jgi:aminoglycoside phosphotransferase (APT) family kinase protein
VPIANASPRLGARAMALAAAMAEHPPEDGEPVLVHGSYSAAHVIDMGGGAGVIDWDGFGHGPRELDAATFLAAVARMAAGRREVARRAAAAAAVFRGAIAADVDPCALAWYEAGARIRSARHVCVHRPPGWADRAASLLTPWPAGVRHRPWTDAGATRSG